MVDREIHESIVNTSTNLTNVLIFFSLRRWITVTKTFANETYHVFSAGSRYATFLPEESRALHTWIDYTESKLRRVIARIELDVELTWN